MDINVTELPTISRSSSITASKRRSTASKRRSTSRSAGPRPRSENCAPRSANSLEATIHILPQLLEAPVGVLTHGSHLVEECSKLLAGRKRLQHHPPQFVTYFGMLSQQRGQISPELLYELCLRHISRYPCKAVSFYTRALCIIVPIPLPSGKVGPIRCRRG